MENETIFDRIAQIIEIECNGVPAQFAKKIGSKDQTVRNIVVNRRSYPGYEILLKIIQSIDWLNPDWLITGRGEMRKGHDKSNQVITEPEAHYETDINRQLINIIDSQQRTIENLTSYKKTDK
ncbi:hypothetical protein SAMN05216365_1024 [Porphyromonadaceae bacterium NLAE-zl-C104]|nr:hypothetical protein SAMN05216331_1584 [Porphyromonadaceae bacterium KH3R12]SFS31561.1 hypothetical protein SAMN05216365_1024 [Porphyromonadaceae bacterium NLAE-zl-C104]